MSILIPLTVGLTAAVPDSTHKPPCSQTNITPVPAGKYKIAEITPFPAGVMGMAVNDEGILYFSDTYSRVNDVSAVYALAPPYTGDPVPTGITGRSIAGLLWHEEKLYVAFLNKNEIIIYDRNLEFLESRVVDSPWGFFTNGKNVFVYTYFGYIGMITNNRVSMFSGKLDAPIDMVYSGRESLWVSERAGVDSAGRLVEVGMQGEIIDTLACGIMHPFGLERDENDNFYVADNEMNALYIVPPDGKPALITDQYKGPLCITTDHLGRLLVNTNHNGGTLLVIRLPR